ncbi:MAG: hypothetical protein HY516_01810 [Candidatus Aenigmarchaeota archaeon]|nr:hypothetical protein [Candidatus Aenigmarchaeota archaeon]
MNMKQSRKHLDYAMLFFGLVVFFWSFLSLFNSDGDSYAGKSGDYTSSGQPDKCKTPSGYTDDEWREHMGHHPAVYAECLK